VVVCTASSSDSAAETGPKSGELTAPAAAAASLSVTSPSVDKARRKPACVLPGLHAASTRQHARATRRITQSLRCHRSREHICVSTIADEVAPRGRPRQNAPCERHAFACATCAGRPQPSRRPHRWRPPLGCASGSLQRLPSAAAERQRGHSARGAHFMVTAGGTS